MFGNLFSDDSIMAGAGHASVSAVPLPPTMRPACQLAGIDNLGATCYLNSLLQTLIFTPEFREKLFVLQAKELGDLKDRESPNARVRVIPLQLRRLFAQLLLSNQQSVSTLSLTSSFGWTNHEEFQQHDAQELNRILFSAIEDSLMGTQGQSIIKELYHGTIVNQIICLKCKKVSEKEEDFLDLTLAIAGLPGLEAALSQCYRDVEKMDGKNQYRCETCNTYVDATKGAKLRQVPSVLTISLLRFSFDFVKMSRYKENGRFTFPMELDMRPYFEQKVEADSDSMYELFSVVVHRGGAYGGHYFAYIRDIDNLGDWDLQSAPATANVTPSVSGLDVIECQSPVDLVENILGQLPHGAMSMDKLCAEITKVTGVSWNKRFRKTHGPIYKFLQNSNSFFYNADSNWVSLRSSVDPKEAEVEGQENTEGGDQGTDKDASQSQQKTQGKDKRPSTPAPDAGHRWFCFNDSRVCAISERDIEQQFSGKESAYMLFYRRKSLVRPQEANGNRAYNVPEELIKEVEELNKSLAKQREEYERTVNQISLRVFHQDDFCYDGTLRSKCPGEPNNFVVDVDRRVSFGFLREEITKQLELRPDNVLQNFSLHRIGSCCNGLHLYEEFTDKESSLQELGLTSDASLFVWNGSVISNEFVPVGEATEPVLILVRDSDLQDQLCQVILGKDKSLTHLYQIVAGRLGADPGDLTLCHLAQLGDQGSHNMRVIQKTEDVSVSQSGLGQGSVLVVGQSSASPSIDASGSSSTSTQGEHQDVSVVTEPHWSITLQERLAGSLGQVTCRTAVARCRPSQTVGELKVMALTLLQATGVEGGMVRLREDHRTQGMLPPLKEGLSVQDCGLSDGACVVLESGRPPQEMEMTISVNKVEGGKLCSKQEMLVDRGLTVQGLLQAARSLMDCDGNDWYLSKTDVFGEAAEALENPDASLAESLVNDGDMLVLKPGRLVKKDEVTLTVSLVKEVDDELAGGDRQEAEDRCMLEMASKLSMSSHVSSQELNPLSRSLCPTLHPLFDHQLVLPKSMGVEALKEALMATQSCQELRLPTTGFMRLRLVEGGRMRAVVRGGSQALRHANHKEGLHLAMQILRAEENLGVHEVLLLVSLKVSGARVYLPAQEFTWLTSGGQGAADLKRQVCQRMDLATHDVLLAKYTPEAASWMVLRDTPPKTAKNNKGKKAGSKKTNIRQAPYFVQDGDLIGVKIISADKGILDTEDFSTQEDIDKRLLMQQIADEKKRMREEKKKQTSMDTLPSQRRPEVALTIKVDKFS